MENGVNQTRPTETLVAARAWLAGILDGEGCLTSKRTSQRGLTCVITIESVSEAMLQRVQEILDRVGIAWVLEGPLWRKRSTRCSYRVRVYRKAAVLALCNLLLPYSVVKQSELLVFQEFLTKACAVAYYRATVEDLELPRRIRELKRRA